jgi:RNA polymerase sigma-70 factor (ECF subfamily)
LHNERRKKRFTSLTEELRDASAQADQISEDYSELDDVLNVMQRLPEIDRTVLMMKAQDELSYEEIARSTGLSLSAVKVKVFRARIKLNSLLAERQGAQK